MRDEFYLVMGGGRIRRKVITHDYCGSTRIALDDGKEITPGSVHFIETENIPDAIQRYRNEYYPGSDIVLRVVEEMPR